MEGYELPLFPLHTVLFPRGPLPLRIFEPRYLDMIGRCMRTGTGFGVCLIRSGDETGPAEIQEIGTVARIRDWERRKDGLLGISVVGEIRFQVLKTQVQKDGLRVAEVRFLDEAAGVPVPAAQADLVQLVRMILPQVARHYEGLESKYDDADWVGCRLSEILPFSLSRKQALLELDDPLHRLETLRPLIAELRAGSV